MRSSALTLEGIGKIPLGTATWAWKACISEPLPQVVNGCNAIEIAVQTEYLQNLSQDGEANAQVTCLQPANGHPGDQGSRGHLRLRHPSATSCRTNSLA